MQIFGSVSKKKGKDHLFPKKIKQFMFERVVSQNEQVKNISDWIKCQRYLSEKAQAALMTDQLLLLCLLFISLSSYVSVFYRSVCPRSV